MYYRSLIHDQSYQLSRWRSTNRTTTAGGTFFQDKRKENIDSLTRTKIERIIQHVVWLRCTNQKNSPTRKQLLYFCTNYSKWAFSRFCILVPIHMCTVLFPLLMMTYNDAFIRDQHAHNNSRQHRATISHPSLKVNTNELLSCLLSCASTLACEYLGNYRRFPGNHASVCSINRVPLEYKE